MCVTKSEMPLPVSTLLKSEKKNCQNALAVATAKKDMEKEKNSKITREEALRRLETARKLKREYVAKLEKEMKEEFKKRTGQEATYFEVW